MKIRFTFFFIVFSGCILYSQDLSKEHIIEITEAIPGLIKDHYVFPEKGKEISEKIQRKVRSKVYTEFTEPNALALVLTKDLKELGNDGHLYVTVKKKSDNEENINWEDIEKHNEIEKNFGFTDIKILENNIGYLKIVEFMHPKRSMPTAVAAMKIVEQTQALIIDLRNNGGGYPGIMEYILHHYFDGPPEHVSTTYFAKAENTDKTYTSDLIYGKLRIGTPLYILINSKTGSAAEYFAYTLQAFNKAIVVGEKSAGAAHMNDFFELPHGFKISISVAAPINAKTHKNWELTGVIPDYITTSDLALQKALGLLMK